MNEIISAGPLPAIDSLHAWGIAVIHAFQTIACPAITALAQAFTFLGEPWIYLAVIPLLFWCVDERRGARVALALLISNGIVSAIKVTLAVPRPGRFDPSVELITPPDPWSTPSGHSSGSAVLWPLAMLDRNRYEAGTNGRAAKRLAPRLAPRLAVAIGIPLLVGLSRVYLGVHYPTDVLFGWAIGAAFSLTVLIGLPALKALAEAGDADGAAGNPVARVWRSLAAYRESTGRSFRSFKLALAALVAFALNALNPADSSMGGAVFGFAAGYIILTDTGSRDDEKRSLPRFSARDGKIPQKALRLVLGVAALVGLYIGLKRVLPGELSPYYSLCRFIRYGLLGLWVSLGAPLAFAKIGLAGKPAAGTGAGIAPRDADKAE